MIEIMTTVTNASVLSREEQTVGNERPNDGMMGNGNMIGNRSQRSGAFEWTHRRGLEYAQGESLLLRGSNVGSYALHLRFPSGTLARPERSQYDQHTRLDGNGQSKESARVPAGDASH
eukprot:GHVU01012979.1.p3 GENE.GHVU01012979.1~~GHVU01012979.1.p3  ORF type:complete len:118 (+),score=6.24 GHVU01012979.1:535-888(+)